VKRSRDNKKRERRKKNPATHRKADRIQMPGRARNQGKKERRDTGKSSKRGKELAKSKSSIETERTEEKHPEKAKEKEKER